MSTPEFMHLLALRGGIILEGKGLRRSKGSSALAIAKREFGFSRYTPRTEVLTHVERLIKEYKNAAHGVQSTES